MNRLSFLFLGFISLQAFILISAIYQPQIGGLIFIAGSYILGIELLIYIGILLLEQLFKKFRISKKVTNNIIYKIILFIIAGLLLLDIIFYGSFIIELVFNLYALSDIIERLFSFTACFLRFF